MFIPRCFVLASLLACSFGCITSGCKGHGKYTKEHTNVAKEKMSMLKSATEYQMAFQAFIASDLEKAARHIDYSLGLAPGVAKSHVLKGRVMLEMGNLERAAACFEQATQIAPENVEAAYYQGVLNERVARKEEALQCYQRAANLDGTNAQYCVAAAEMLIDLGRLDEADAYLRQRLETFVNNAGVKQVLGNIAMLKSDSKSAQVLYSEARLLDPANQSVVENLVRAQLANGDIADAEVNLDKLLNDKSTKNRRDLIHTRAECLAQLDRPIEARDLYIELTRDSTGAADVKAWRGLGHIAFLLKDTQRAKLCAARLIAIAPQSSDGWLLRGLINRRAGDLPAAKMNLEHAILLNAGNDALVILGLVYQDMHQYPQAKAAFQQVLNEEPQHPAALQLITSVPVE